MISRWVNQTWNAWDKFWFAPRSAWTLGLFRLCVGIPLFFLYLNRHFYLETFYSDQGMLPIANIPDVFLPMTYPGLVWYIESFPLLTWAHGLFLFLILLMSFGFLPRPFGFLLWGLHMSFLQRNFAIAYGVDIVANIWFLYLAFCGTHGVNIYTLWKNSTSVKKLRTDFLSSVGYRLIQIHLCVIYVYTGIEKLKGTSWWDGTALWRVWGNPQMVVMDMSFVLAVPIVVAVLTFLTLLFEIYFPVLIWMKRWRIPLVAMGIFFHGGIALTLALPVFSMCMMATYLLFLEEDLVGHKI